MNQVYGSLYANGFGTVVPDALFVNLSSVVTQSTPLPGFGFRNLSGLPTNQQTQVYSTTVSPFLRKSFDGLVDTQLQYTFNSTNFGGNTTVATAPAGTPTNLASSTSNEGTFIATTGQDFSRTLARVTLDASNFNSGSTNQNSQFSGFTDLEYRIAPQAAALARVGYQSIQYPFAPAATFVGPTWLIGGAIGTYGSGPGGPGYFSLEYGRQQGVYGFTGSAHYNITPTMIFTASLVQGLGSPGQDIGSTLATSTLDPYGSIVKLLILTGQRREEIGGLRFEEIGDGIIALPASRSKNKRAHVIPLTAPALAILAARALIDADMISETAAQDADMLAWCWFRQTDEAGRILTRFQFANDLVADASRMLTGHEHMQDADGGVDLVPARLDAHE